MTQSSDNSNRARIIAVTNQKGGVGKTTTSVNLSAALAATKRRVLMIDLDPQGNATMGAGVDKNDVDKTICDVLLDKLPIADAVQHSPDGGFDVLPANGDLTAAEVGLIKLIGREQVLGRALESVLGDYDFILIDCPPSLNLLTLNALAASDRVLIPMQCEYYALEGLSALLNTMEQIRTAVNPRLQIEGILRTMFDARARLSIEVSRQLLNHFDEKVYRTVIPRNIRLAEAPSHGQSVIQYDRGSRGARAYLALAGEMLRREEQLANQPVASAA